MHTTCHEQFPANVNGQHHRRLLIPVDATERSRWAIRYVLHLRDAGVPVAVALIFVAEPITAWEVRRFLTDAEIVRFQADTGRHILEDAARELIAADIPVQPVYREGDIAFEIVDAAERLECDEIVLPLPHARWAKLLSPDVVREVIRRQGAVRVTTVAADGRPEASHRH